MLQFGPRLTRFARNAHLRHRLINPLRYYTDSLGLAINIRAEADVGTRRCRVLLLSDGLAPTSEQQLNPFYRYRPELKRRLQLVSLHLLVGDALRLPRFALKSFDIFAVKLSFKANSSDVLRIIRQLRSIAGTRPLLYLDGDDDICILHPEILAFVDLYIKKHAFKDRQQYLRRLIGKSNLTDHVHREFGVSFADNPHATETRPVPTDQLHKIVVGWNLALDSNIMELRDRNAAAQSNLRKDVDVMFRGNVPSDWLLYLRKDIEPTLEKLKSSYKVIIPKARVARDEYYQEMLRSKICISPFGYGEICWRDVEAILCKCLIVKPDMSHVETSPNIFIEYETYVPVRWDYADLEEKCSFYVFHTQERERIISRAYDLLTTYYDRKEFVACISNIVSRTSHIESN